MKLQIKDSGAWRNLFSLTDQQRPQVLAAAASLLTALNQPQTVMRLMENDVVLDSCAGPDFRWHGQSTCTCPSGDGSLSWPCPSRALPATVPSNWVQFVESCAEAECCTINSSAIARRARKLIEGIGAALVQPVVVPDGWALIPTEPNDAMQVAGAQAVRIDTTVINKIWTSNAVFRAMMAAAPAVPAVQAAP